MSKKGTCAGCGDDKGTDIRHRGHPCGHQFCDWCDEEDNDECCACIRARVESKVHYGAEHAMKSACSEEDMPRMTDAVASATCRDCLAIIIQDGAKAMAARDALPSESDEPRSMRRPAS